MRFYTCRLGMEAPGRHSRRHWRTNGLHYINPTSFTEAKEQLPNLPSRRRLDMEAPGRHFRRHWRTDGLHYINPPSFTAAKDQLPNLPPRLRFYLRPSCHTVKL
ncbi:unnamed protein product [Closterium sp. NIES-54]